MKMFAALVKNWQANPLPYFLIFIIALSLFSHYRTGARLTYVCSQFEQLEQGYFDLADIGEKANFLEPEALAAIVHDHERLMSEDSREGREYRWRLRTTRDLEKACAGRSKMTNPPWF